MLEVTEPQVWTLIGVFATALFGVLTLMSTMFVRVLNAGFSEMDAKFAGLRAEMNAKFDSVDAKLNHLDRDVQAIARRVFPEHE